MKLVTGGSGYFGVNLVNELIKRGDDVRIFDITEPPGDVVGSSVEFFRGDITDFNAVKKACKGVDTVYHTVALVPLSRAGKRFRAVNVDGTKCILEASLKSGVSSFVHISTSAVYGVKPQGLINENVPLKPFREYGAAKFEAEEVCFDYMDKGLGVSIIRPRAIIGPGRLGIFAVLFEWLKKGKNLYIIGSGDNKYQMVSAYDLADACILASKKGLGEVFNLGSDEFLTVRRELKELANYAGTGSKIVSINATLVKTVLEIFDFLRISPLVSWQYMSGGEDFVFDTTKAKRILGWKPRHSDTEMLKRAYDWYVEHYDEIKHSVGTTHRQIPKSGILKLIGYFS